MPGIFINYRREDSAGYAQRLFEVLAPHFGKDRVFIDIDSIESGADFDAVIRDRLAQCDVFLALIGPNWEHCTDQQGVRRLLNPADFVRREIAQALQRQMAVIPVLVGGARVPRTEELPADIRTLTAHNAHEMPDRFFKESTHQLIGLLDKFVRRPTRRVAVWLGSGAVLLVGAGILLDSRNHNTAQNSAAPPVKSAESGPILEATGPTDPRVVVRVPNAVSALPVAAPGHWKVNTFSVSKQVVGPRKTPHLLWACNVTIGDMWHVVGFAPDETLYLWDEENTTVSGVRQGKELWAYRAEFMWHLAGMTPDGLLWTKDEYPAHIACFNSRGEGGFISGMKRVPPSLLADSRAQPVGSCLGGAIRMGGRRASIPLDGNCLWVAEDETGKLYGGTDRGTVYCLSAEGAVLWQVKVAKTRPSEPVFSNGDLIFANDDHLVCVRDGLIRWDRPFAECKAAFADKAGTTYISYSRGPMAQMAAAVDRDGNELWKVQSRYEPIGLDPAGRLYLSDRSTLVCAALTGRS